MVEPAPACVIGTVERTGPIPIKRAASRAVVAQRSTA